MKENNFNFNQAFFNTLDSNQLLSFLHLDNISANIPEKSLSILLSKASFAFLLIAMLSYWFQMSFKSEMFMKCASYLPKSKEGALALPLRGTQSLPLLSSEAELLPHTPVPHTPKGYRGKEVTSHKKFSFATPVRALRVLLGKQSLPLQGMQSGGLGNWELRGSSTYPSGLLRTKEAENSSVNVIHKETKVMITCNKTDRKNFFEKVPFVSMWSANITLALLLSIRWIESGHFPLSNLYESLIFLSWSLTVIHLFLENLFHKREQILYSQASDPTFTLGAIISPVALFTNAFATFSLPQEMQKVTVLVPALKSNWLIMHVSVMIISYAALLSGSLLAMAFLVIKFIDDNKIINYVSSLTQLIDKGLVFMRSKKLYPSASYSSASFVQSNPEGYAKQSLSSNRSLLLTPLGVKYVQSKEEVSIAEDCFAYPSGVKETEGSEPLLLKSSTKEEKVLIDLPQILDNLSYRSIGLGFALLTIGILSGAVWANEAWGSYWSWDPKETWAFITWLVFALYLHTRLSKGWVGKESAFVASFGFIVIWFCYLGVNLFGKGLHSYGWFQQ